MKINALYADAFRDYEKPLQKLEEAFNAAGWGFKFHLFVHPQSGEKVVEVIGGCASQNIISIEADNPAMAVKDVAKGVKIW